MRSRLGSSIAIATLGLTVSAVGCSSDSDSTVRISAVVDYDADVPNFEDNRGTFTAEGDLCSAGTFSNTGIDFEEGDPNRLTSRYQFNCGDGSGLFFILSTVEGDTDDFETISAPYDGTWAVEEGSGLGDYSDATGSGTFTGRFEPDWIDEITGGFSK